MKTKFLPLLIILLVSKVSLASNELSVSGGGAYSTLSELSASAFAVEGFHFFDVSGLELGVGLGYSAFGRQSGSFAAATNGKSINESYKPSALLVEAKVQKHIGKLAPYMVGGIGQAHQEFSVSGAVFANGSTSGTVNTLGLMGGAGMIYDITDHLFIGGEVRDMYMPSTTVGGTDVNASMLVSVLARAGVRF